MCGRGPTPPHPSRRTLYRQLGIAEQPIGRRIKFGAANLWARGKRAGRIVLGEIGAGLSPYPFMLVISQDRIVALRTKQLARRKTPSASAS